MIAAYEEGVFTSKNQTVASHWDIPSAIFFSTTVVTTIGTNSKMPVLEAYELIISKRDRLYDNGHFLPLLIMTNSRKRLYFTIQNVLIRINAFSIEIAQVCRW